MGSGEADRRYFRLYPWRWLVRAAAATDPRKHECIRPKSPKEKSENEKNSAAAPGRGKASLPRRRPPGSRKTHVAEVLWRRARRVLRRCRRRKAVARLPPEAGLQPGRTPCLRGLGTNPYELCHAVSRQRFGDGKGSSGSRPPPFKCCLRAAQKTMQRTDPMVIETPPHRGKPEQKKGAETAGEKAQMKPSPRKIAARRQGPERIRPRGNRPRGNRPRGNRNGCRQGGPFL